MALRFVDLSLPIYHGAPTFSPDPKCGVLVHHTIKSFGYNITQLVMSSHQGTHLDAPFHFLEKGATVDRLALSRCAGRALVVDLRRAKAKEELRPVDFAPWRSRIGQGTKLLLMTGWWKRFPKPSFFSDSPRISVALARWLARRKIDLLGVDFPGVNPVDYEVVHKTLLGAKVVIVEALAHLEDLKEPEPFFVAAPLKLKGRDGSPVRAFAIEGLPEG